MQFSQSVFRWIFEKQFSLHRKDTGSPQSNLQQDTCVCSISKSSFPLWQVEVFNLFPSFLHHTPKVYFTQISCSSRYLTLLYKQIKYKWFLHPTYIKSFWEWHTVIFLISLLRCFPMSIFTDCSEHPFAQTCTHILGVCAMQPSSSSEFELSCISPNARSHMCYFLSVPLET